MAGMEQLSPELYAKLQRRLCITEGKKEEAQQPRDQDDMAVEPTRSARMRFHAMQASKNAEAREARRVDRRRKLTVARPLAPVTYCPSEEDRAESNGSLPEGAQGTFRDLMSPVLSDRIITSAEVYEMMDDEENVEGEEDPYDDYYETLQAFLPVDGMKTGIVNKVVNLLELGEVDVDSASTCSLDTQEAQSAQSMIDRENRDKEIQYLQQRLTDAYAEREIHLAAAKEEAGGKEKALATLAAEIAEAESAHVQLQRQLDTSKTEAEHWRKEAARLQVSNGDLVRAAQAALRALHCNGARKVIV